MRSLDRIIVALVLAGIAWVPAATAAEPIMTADQAVKLALERNSQIIGAEAGVLDARSGVYSSLSGVLPRLSASLSRSGSQTLNQQGTRIVAGSVAFPTTTDESYYYATEPTLSGQWSILNLAAFSTVSSARQGLKGAQWQRQATRSDVALEARRLFYEVVKAVKMVDVYDDAVALARDDERRVRTLYEVGSVSRSDLLKAQVRTAQAQVDSIGSRQTLLVQRDLLASFIGMEESRLGTVDTVLSFHEQTYDEASLLREAEASRPDVKAAEAEVRAARASLTAARLNWLPYVTVSGSATYDPSSASKSVLTEGVVSGRIDADRTISGQIALNWDVFNGLQNSAASASARARLARAQAARDVLRLNLASEVHEALLTYQQALGLEAVAGSGVESATENLKLTQQKYNVGSATILDLIDAQVQLKTAQGQMVSGLAAIRVAEARLDRVRGRAE